MSSCNICLDHFKRPVSLPCGHVFCTECIVKTVQAVRPMRNVHQCPMCRTPYNVVPLNPLVVPPHLRPFMTPTIRRVYIDSPETTGESSSASIPPKVAEELVKLRTENHTLRSHCVLWRRRAELHGAATLGLLDFARAVREQAAGLTRERDQYRRECQNLKRKLDDYEQVSKPDFFSSPEHASTSSPCKASYLPQGLRFAPTSSTSPSPSGLSCPPTVEASRLAVAALFDLHSYMKDPTPAPTPIAQNLDFSLSPRQPQSMPEPSGSSFPVYPSSASAPLLATSSMSSPSAGSPSGNAPSPANLEQPPRKRARRDSFDSPAEPASDRRRRQRLHASPSGYMGLESLPQSTVVGSGLGTASVAGSSSR